MNLHINPFWQFALELRSLLYRKRSKRINGMRVMRMKRRAGNPKRYRILASSLALGALTSIAQPLVYDNFEGRQVVIYAEKSGVLDTAANNPGPDAVNSSATCALYVRNGSKKFDNIKMKLKSGLTEVEKYATYLGEPPRLKMKVRTNAPAGTLVEILLGSKEGNNAYPAGTHSQYQAYTTRQNSWEELEFKFSQIPEGSETPAGKVDQLTLLFNPNTSSSDTYYFDEISGPPLVPAGPQLIAEPENKPPAEPKKKKQKK